MNPLDDPGKEWCFLLKSTTVIGVPFVPRPIQVTFDGAVFTGNAELCFFYGPGLTPVLLRQKSFLNGWIPVVTDSWKIGDITYDIEIFGADIAPFGSDNTIQFVRYRMTNTGARPTEGTITAAVRGSGEDSRLGQVPALPPQTLFRMTDRAFFKDDRLLFTFHPGAERFAVPGQAYVAPFKAADHALTSRAEMGLVMYHKRLEPGETFTAIFKMPRMPLFEADAIATAETADYDQTREKVIAFWTRLIEGHATFSIPEKRVNDSYRASLIHLILATRGHGGKDHRQGSGLPYDDLFLNDYFDMLLAYDTAGLTEFAEPNIDWLLQKQHTSGMFIDVHNRGDDTIVTSHGQALFCLAYHGLMTRDKAYGRKVYPAICKGVELIIHDHKTNKYGLLRPSIPYDAPMLEGHHTCHNLFGLLALQASIRMARFLGEKEDTSAWTEVWQTYKQAIIKAVDEAYRKEGYITSGLYDWTRWVQGNPVYRGNECANQDWENNLLVYPSELLDPDDPRVAVTLATIRRRKYCEGCMTYRNGQHIHQYITLNQANQYLAIGDQKHALLDLYHVLLHNGSTHEGFENLVEPWTRTVKPTCPPPHAWAAAKTALFIRNLMVVERGGHGGLDESARDLWLFSLISPAWEKPGNKLEIRNAPTEMGTVSASLAFSKNSAVMNVDAKFHRPPQHIVFRIPWFLTLELATADGAIVRDDGGVLRLRPDVKTVSLAWVKKPGIHKDTYQEILKSYRMEYGYIKDPDGYKQPPPEPFLLDDEIHAPAEPLSFDLIRRAYQKEYERRIRMAVSAGDVATPVEAPALVFSTHKRNSA